jgi:signal transduction histidine kinase
VVENQLSSKDVAKIGEWTRHQQYVTITIRGEHTRLVAGHRGASVTEIPPSESSASLTTSGQDVYYLRFSDGVFQISISDSSQSLEYVLITIIAVVLACAAIITIMFLYIRHVTARVVELANIAQEIGSGDLQREIHLEGKDEIAQLGRDVDDMRRSIIERMDSERKAWKANSSLITAISHDVRTPMTAMIGYLELLENGEYTDEEQRRDFITGAHAKAMELKSLTDELFKYFLVFGGEDIHLEMETYDAGILLDQLVGEASVELSASGFNVHVVKFKGECSIKVDVLHLKRVFDNLFSNVRKYADPSRPVVVLSEIVNGKYLSVCVSNSIDKSQSRVESTKIGLQTCEKIVTQLGGVFKTNGDEGHFVAEIILPIVNEIF